MDETMPCGHSTDNLVKGNVRRTDAGDCAVCLLHDEIERLTLERDILAAEVERLRPAADYLASLEKIVAEMDEIIGACGSYAAGGVAPSRTPASTVAQLAAWVKP